MPGRPMRTALRAWLDRRIAELHEDEPPSHLEYVCYRMAEGTSLLALTNELTFQTQLPYHGHSIRRLLEQAFGEQYAREEMDKARLLAADALVDEAGQILDDLPGSPLRTKDGGVILDPVTRQPLLGSPDRDAITLADKRSQYRLWKAAKLNRKVYGDDKAPAVNLTLSVQDLRIDGLRAFHQLPAPPTLPAPPPADSSPLPLTGPTDSLDPPAQ